MFSMHESSFGAVSEGFGSETAPVSWFQGPVGSSDGAAGSSGCCLKNFPWTAAGTRFHSPSKTTSEAEAEPEHIWS